MRGLPVPAWWLGVHRRVGGVAVEYEAAGDDVRVAVGRNGGEGSYSGMKEALTRSGLVHKHDGSHPG